MDNDTGLREIDIVPAYGSGAAEHRKNDAIRDWKTKSENGEVCGIFGCDNTPNLHCPKCKNHYCDEHIVPHFHKKTASISW